MGLAAAIRPKLRDGDPVKPRITTGASAKTKRAALEYAHGARFWTNLRTSMDECRARGIPLPEAKRLLQERLAVESRETATAKKTT
jgi:hypothetical protein